MFSSIVTCPLDVAKTRLQNQGAGTPVYRGSFGTLHKILLDEGIRGWYRGLTPTMLGYLPSWAIYFSVYETMKSVVAEAPHTSGTRREPRALRQHRLRQFLMPAAAELDLLWQQMISAVAAGACSTSLTNPLWLIKTRMMVRAGHVLSSTGASHPHISAARRYFLRFIADKHTR